MSDLSLSQDEIDLLLTGGGAPAPSQKSLSDALKNALSGYFSEIAPAQAQALGGMVDGKTVKIDPPAFDLTDKDGFLDGLPPEIVEISVDFSSPGAAKHSYFFDPGQLSPLVGPIMGQEEVEINDNAVNAMEEVGSLFAGSMVTTLSNKTGQDVVTNPPSGEKKPKAMAQMPGGDIVRAHFRIHVNGSSLDLWEALPLELMENLSGVSSAGSPDAGMSNVSMDDFGMSGGGAQPTGGTGMTGFSANQMAGGAPQMGGGMGAQMGFGAPQGGGMGGVMNPPNIQGVQLPNLMPGLSSSEMGNIGLLMDVSMEVTVELGRARRSIKEILGMGEGTIIALDKLAGEAVDILVNHKLIAKGEVVVIDENFGVRVTEIVSGGDKINEL